MDLQFWIWLIVIVITLIARANKKKAGQAPPPENIPDQSRRSQPATQQPPTKQQPVTFEDLLREIQGEKALSKPVASKPKEPEYDFVDYDDNIPDEIQDLEDVDYDHNKDERAFQTYEAALKEAEKTPLVKESPNVGSIMRSEHFKEYSIKKKKVSFNFLNELKDPQGFKKAFIMSEILNKKY
ncbi:MAG: hypothetical protein WAU36_13520 [Cyclobacteriaceae bacterium]